MPTGALKAKEPGAGVATAPRRWAPPARYGLAVLSVGAALGLALILEHFHFRDGAVPLLLFACAISAWYGGQGPALLASVLSTAVFYWYFIEPVRTPYIDPSEIPFFVIFVAFASLISWFSAIRRRAESTLREQANLLNLTHDTVFVMDMDGVIRYWNRGAEVRYGWTANEIQGKLVHDVLRTVFPSSLRQIEDELMSTGRWEGELVHTRRDGSQVEVASRWSLQRDARGTPVAILETNNDITERKRAEEALRRLNRELRALSNCNQALLRATDEQTLLQEVCRILCEEAGYRPVWVSFAEHDEAKSVRPVAWAGTDEAYLAIAKITWAEDSERGRGPTGTAIRSGRACCVQDFSTDDRVAPWRDVLLRGGYRSGIALPLRDEKGDVFGSLTMHSSQPGAFTPDETRLLEELAGDLAFGIVTLRSRTARKRAEQEVALLSFALNNVRESALLIDESGRIHYVNEAACRVLGYTRAELIGTRVPDIDPEFPTERWADHWRDLQAQRSLSFETRHRRRDGSTFPVEVSANYFEYGGQAYNLALARDITERKQAEKALLENERYLAEAQRLSHTGSWALDLASGKYVYVSEEHYRIFGLDPREGPPGKDDILRRIHPQDLTRWKENFERALRENGDSSDEYRILLPDGTVKHIHTIRHVVMDDAGHAVSLVGTSVDVTESRLAAEALRRTAAYLAETQRLTHTGTFVADPTTAPVYWSEEMFGVFGFDPQEGLPTREQPLERIHPDDFDGFWQAFQRTIREKVDADAEFRIVRPDGTVRYAYGIAHPVLNADGELVEVVGSTVDITERKLVEQALRRSEAYLAEAQRLTHTGAWATDAAPEPLYWSDELFRLYGLDPKNGLPTHDQAVERVHPEDREKYRQAFRRVIHQKEDSDVEFRTVWPDGTIRYLYGLGHPVLNAHGDLVEVVGTSVDITERKRAEEALRESETRFRTFVDHAADAFFMLDFEQGAIIDVNRQACESLGFTREELIGTTPLAFDVDLDPAVFRSIADRAATGETTPPDKHWHRRKDGSRFPVEVHTSVFWHGGRRFLLKVARDISDRVRAEEQRGRLHRLEADLAHMNRVSMMGELAASVAHEVNQPISGVVSNAGACLRWLAKEVPNVQEAQEAARRIVRDGKRAGEIIARIRALARKADTRREMMDLNETIREVLALVADVVKKQMVTIEMRFAEDLAPVSGDRVQLQQVVLNLVMNAIEAMNTVSDRARVLVVATRNIDPGQVQVTVEDSGTGLDPKAADKIFDAFYTTRPGGMGMGLSISRSIVQAHEGRLWATARDGPGTSFHFVLPKYDEGADAGV